jgi:MFS family permease
MIMAERYGREIWKAYAFRFSISLHFIGGVLVPFFTDWGGISFTQIMIIQSWFMFWVFILEMPTGAIADHLGRRTSLILGAVVNIIAVFIYTSAPIFYVFLVAEFTWALAEALVSGAGEAFIYDTLNNLGETEKSKRVFGRYQSFMLLGFMVAGPIGSVFAFYFGLQYAMILMAVPFSVAVVIGLTLTEPQIGKRGERKPYLQTLKSGVKFVFQQKILKILAFDMVSIGVLAFLMIWLYQPMLMTLAIPIAFFGIVQAIWIGFEILIMNNYGKLESLLRSKRRYLIFSALLTGVMFIIGGLALVSGNIPLTLISIISVCAFGLTRMPLLISYMNKHIPSPERATILSTINMFHTLGLVIAFPLIGIFSEWSLAVTLIVVGLLAVGFTFVSRVKEEYLID